MGVQWNKKLNLKKIFWKVLSMGVHKNGIRKNEKKN